eukprot:SAG31_NODE_11103_length_1066_cov_1.101344_1_plen_54_part_01
MVKEALQTRLHNLVKDQIPREDSAGTSCHAYANLVLVPRHSANVMDMRELRAQP